MRKLICLLLILAFVSPVIAETVTADISNSNAFVYIKKPETNAQYSAYVLVSSALLMFGYHTSCRNTDDFISYTTGYTAMLCGGIGLYIVVFEF